MKHVKILGLLVMAAASLMAFASSASAAPILTAPAGNGYLGTIHATLEKGTTALLKAGIEDTCTESTAHGEVILNNGVEAEGQLTEAGTPPTGLTFGSAATPCTKETKTIKAGKLTINDAGEVFTKESRVEVHDKVLGVTCFYGAETGSVKIGTFAGGTPAKLNVSTTTLQKEAGSGAFCAANGTWTGTYVVTTPTTLLFT